MTHRYNPSLFFLPATKPYKKTDWLAQAHDEKVEHYCHSYIRQLTLLSHTFLNVIELRNHEKSLPFSSFLKRNHLVSPDASYLETLKTLHLHLEQTLQKGKETIEDYEISLRQNSTPLLLARK